MKYHLKWISALLALLVLLAAGALAETGADGESAAYATILQAEALPGESAPAEPASTPEAVGDAPEVPGAETAVPGVRVEFHIYYGEETGASLTEYSGGTYPIVLENLAPGSAVEAPALPGSLIVNGAEYAPSDSVWKSSGAGSLSDVRQDMSFSAVYLRVRREANYTVRHRWLGDPDAEIYEDAHGTAVVGEILRWDAPAEVPGYAFLRAGEPELIVSADESRNEIVLYYSRELKLTSQSAEKIYDGTELSCNEVLLTGKLAGTDVLCVLLDGGVTDVGTAENSFSQVAILRDGQDVTSNGEYAVTLEEGALTVLPAPLEITAGSDYKRRDGTPLTCGQWALSAGRLAEGHSVASIQVTGSQTELGESPNTPSDAVIVDEDGADVTANYAISYCSGTLGVTERLPLIVIANSAAKDYDGAPLSDGGFTCNGLLEGDELHAQVRGSITRAGSAENTIESVTITRDGRDVTEEYDVALRSGTLSVRPIEIEITAASRTREYDGTALVCDDWALTHGSLLEGHALRSVRVSGSRTEVGWEANLPGGAVIVDEDGADVTANYDIRYVSGRLRVTDVLDDTQVPLGGDLYR